MTPHENEVRFRAVETLQALLPKHSPGSQRYRVVERALDLAFNETRAVDAYLIRNLLRDARRTLERQAQAGLILSFSADPGDPDYPADLDTFIAEHECQPDLLLEAKQLVQTVVAKTSARSQAAARIFEGLVFGEAIQVTAVACGLSAARVNQVRHEIRAAVALELGADCVH